VPALASTCCSAIPGLITFGQAALFGVGAYAAGCDVLGVTGRVAAWPLHFLISAVSALGIGSLSLRTRGFHFIM